ncbi:hypothetical protein [Propionivibrio sp.]|uniref:hypothetical protein n=1 Tax=Propionivibrio sp. TaxID=2212460 RepID=UPI002602BF56|nr:hypothetical protein [Propionivibrio sp.]
MYGQQSTALDGAGALMPRRILKLVASRLSLPSRPASPAYAFTIEDLAWAMGSLCALNRKPFDPELLIREFPPPYSADSLIHAARALGFRIKRKECSAETLGTLNLPCLVVLRDDAHTPATDAVSGALDHAVANPASSWTIPLPQKSRPAIIIQADADKIVLFTAGTSVQQTLVRADFAARYAGTAFQLALATSILKDPDGAASEQTGFGFSWFIPELLKLSAAAGRNQKVPLPTPAD